MTSEIVYLSSSTNGRESWHRTDSCPRLGRAVRDAVPRAKEKIPDRLEPCTHCVGGESGGYRTDDPHELRKLLERLDPDDVPPGGAVNGR